MTISFLLTNPTIYAKADAQMFIDVSASSKATVQHYPPIFDKRLQHIMEMVSAGASGGAIGDFNKDGWLDIFVNNPRLGAANALLRNNGDMTFTDVIKESGLSAINSKNEVGTMGIFFDYDGDTWQDLLVVRFGSALLFRNDRDGTFTDVSNAAGFKEYVNALTAIAFDYDKDGDIVKMVVVKADS